MNIAVLFGGISPERNVSIAGGISVIEALKSKGHNIIPIDPAYGYNCLRNENELKIIDGFATKEELSEFPLKNLIDAVNSNHFDNIDAAFLVLHGINGEDGKVQTLLELREIPYTGSGVKASSTAIDKAASKILFLAAGVMTPRWVSIYKEDIGNYDLYEEIRSDLGDELVVKPNDQGSTIGISIINTGNLDDINDAVTLASKYSRHVLIEEYISGREITVGIIGNEALPIIEIVPEDGFYDYSHKYTKGKTQYICPAELSDDITEFTQNSALAAYNALGCSGFARADFRLNEEGQVFLLEINTIPGFTSTSLVPKAAAEVGIEFPDLCEKILELALENHK
jgi:D-alanine-D-alanine ligase